MRTAAPDLLWLTIGHAEGETKLNAFDNALIAAGIGHWNLVKVTSVAPKAATFVEGPLNIEAGSVVPAVLASCHSENAGELITACVGVGVGADSHGMIMEHSGPGAPDDMESVVRQMVRESFQRRGLELERIVVGSVSHTVERIGSSVAAVVPWWR